MGDEKTHRFGSLVVGERQHAAWVGDHELSLTCCEHRVLEMLAEHPGWVLSPSELATANEVEYSEESVSVVVSRLRHKLAEAGVTDAIQTVRGFGYRLHASEEPDTGTPMPDEVSQVDRQLRDAAWSLHEAVIGLETSGPESSKRGAVAVLTAARRQIDSLPGRRT